jgi:hypothetical protein
MTEPRAYLAEWSTEQDAELAKLWPSRDLSCSAIGAILGCGKNAVLGRAWRLKLPPRGQPIVLKRKGRGPDRRPRMRHPKPVENDMPRPTPVPEFEVDLEALKTPAWAPLEDTTPIPLLLLSEHTCKWSVLPDNPTALFCGAHSVPGSPYCQTHKQRARGTGTIGEREAVKISKKLRLVGV